MSSSSNDTDATSSNKRSNTDIGITPPTLASPTKRIQLSNAFPGFLKSLQLSPFNNTESSFSPFVPKNVLSRRMTVANENVHPNSLRSTVKASNGTLVNDTSSTPSRAPEGSPGSAMQTRIITPNDVCAHDPTPSSYDTTTIQQQPNNLTESFTPCENVTSSNCEIVNILKKSEDADDNLSTIFDDLVPDSLLLSHFTSSSIPLPLTDCPSQSSHSVLCTPNKSWDSSWTPEYQKYFLDTMLNNDDEDNDTTTAAATAATAATDQAHSNQYNIIPDCVGPFTMSPLPPLSLPSPLQNDPPDNTITNNNHHHSRVDRRERSALMPITSAATTNTISNSNSSYTDNVTILQYRIPVPAGTAQAIRSASSSSSFFSTTTAAAFASSTSQSWTMRSMYSPPQPYTHEQQQHQEHLITALGREEQSRRRRGRRRGGDNEANENNENNGTISKSSSHLHLLPPHIRIPTTNITTNTNTTTNTTPHSLTTNSTNTTTNTNSTANSSNRNKRENSYREAEFLLFLTHVDSPHTLITTLDGDEWMTVLTTTNSTNNTNNTNNSLRDCEQHILLQWRNLLIGQYAIQEYSPGIRDIVQHILSTNHTTNNTNNTKSILIKASYSELERILQHLLNDIDIFTTSTTHHNRGALLRVIFWSIWLAYAYDSPAYTHCKLSSKQSFYDDYSNLTSSSISVECRNKFRTILMKNYRISHSDSHSNGIVILDTYTFQRLYFYCNLIHIALQKISITNNKTFLVKVILCLERKNVVKYRCNRHTDDHYRGFANLTSYLEEMIKIEMDRKLLLQSSSSCCK